MGLGGELFGAACQKRAKGEGLLIGVGSNNQAAILYLRSRLPPRN